MTLKWNISQKTIITLPFVKIVQTVPMRNNFENELFLVMLIGLVEAVDQIYLDHNLSLHILITFAVTIYNTTKFIDSFFPTNTNLIFFFILTNFELEDIFMHLE